MAHFTPLHEAQSQPFPDPVRLSSDSFDSTSTAGALLEDRNTMNALFLDLAIALSEACGWSAVETLMAKRLGASSVPTLASLLSLAYSAGIYTAQSSPSSTSPFIPTKPASTTESSQSAISAKPRPAALAASQTATLEPQPTLVTSQKPASPFSSSHQYTFPKFPPATNAKYFDLARNLPLEPPAGACLFRDKDTANPTITLTYQSISCMPRFLAWSAEELRYMHKLKKSHSPVAAKPFGTSSPLFGPPRASSVAPSFSSSFASPRTATTPTVSLSSNATTGAFQSSQPAAAQASWKTPVQSSSLSSTSHAAGGTAPSFLSGTTSTPIRLPSSGEAFNLFSSFQHKLSLAEPASASLPKAQDSSFSANAAQSDSSNESTAVKQGAHGSLNPAPSGNSTDSLTQIGSASSPSSVAPRTGT